MEERLWRILDNVNRWLEYAERKNAILLTFIGLQLTFFKIFIGSPNFWLIIALILLGICFFIILFSFFPKTSIPYWIYSWSNPISSPRVTDNLIFYGDISKYSLQDYIEKLEKYFDEQISTHNHLNDICSQILINSQLAKRKYNMFKAATWFMIAGQLFFLFSFWR